MAKPCVSESILWGEQSEVFEGFDGSG